jgi:hypothetical protein
LTASNFFGFTTVTFTGGSNLGSVTRGNFLLGSFIGTTSTSFNFTSDITGLAFGIGESKLAFSLGKRLCGRLVCLTN